MKKIRDFFIKLPLGPFSRNVSVLAGGTALGQFLSVLITPVLTRLYPVKDFGYFQIYLSFMTFASLAVTLRLEQAIVLPEQEADAANLVAATLCTVGLMTVIFGAAGSLVAHYGLLPASVEALRPYLWLVAIGLCGAGLYQTFSFWALRQKAYKQIAGTKLTQVTCQLVTQAAVGFLHSGPVGLLLGDVFGRSAGSSGLARMLWLRSGSAIRSVNWRAMWGMAVRYRRFPLVSTGSSLINAAGYVLPVLLIAQLYDAKVLGWFALGERILGAPVILIGQAVSQVYSVEASALCTSNPQGMYALFLKSAKRLALLGIVPLVVFILVAPVLFEFVFGHPWREAGVYARRLAVVHYAALMSWPLMPTLNLLEEQTWQLCWDIGRFILTLGSLWAAHRLGWSPRGAITAFAAAMLLGYVTHLLLSRHAIRKRIRHVQQESAAAAISQPYRKLESYL
jgi:O-antigen/teichoic acid export membrane protein